jgi:hypothetical protein
VGERVKVGTERMLPSLNFKLKFLINIPVSAEEKLNMNFATYCGNNDETRSQKLRGIIFDEVGATNQKEFDKIFIEESNYVKDKIKEKIKERNKYKGNTWFSEMMRNRINDLMKGKERKYIKKKQEPFLLNDEIMEKNIRGIMKKEENISKAQVEEIVKKNFKNMINEQTKKVMNSIEKKDKKKEEKGKLKNAK